MKSNPWDDHYARKAKSEGWVARSVYKLQEIDSRFGIIQKGNRVLDLGCSPGSWAQYCAQKVGPRGEVLGLDINRPARIPIPPFRFLQVDVMSPGLEEMGDVYPRDVVLSDLAPATTGIRTTDASRSLALARKAAALALLFLKTGGNFVCKVFEGEDVQAFRSDLSTHFQAVKTFRPKATRKKSTEVYLVATGRLEDRKKE